MFLTVIGALVLSCTSNKEPNKTMDEFTIRTGVNVSHWLSQSDKRGEEQKNYITRADFDTINWEGIKWIEGNSLNV